MRQNYKVLIKGSQDGLTLHLDDLCAYEDLLFELKAKLKTDFKAESEHRVLSVNVELGNRYISPEQTYELKSLIEENKTLVVAQFFSKVISRKACQENFENNQVKVVAKTVRSGQVIKVPGDVVIVGDVNPGASVVAGGNVYIIGSLRGSVHAGYEQNHDSIIAANHFEPLQLKISNFSVKDISDQVLKTEDNQFFAYVNESGEITFDRIQLLSNIRAQLTSLKGEL